VSIGDHPGDEGVIEETDSVDCVGAGVRSQKDLAADYILWKVACLSKLMVVGRMNR
jgi:hypothetical protein